MDENYNMFEGKKRRYSKYHRRNYKDKNYGRHENYHRNHNSIYDARCMYRRLPCCDLNNNYTNFNNCVNCANCYSSDNYIMDILNSDRGSVRQV